MTPAVDPIVALHESAHACIGVMYGFDVKCAVLHAIGARHDEAGRVELHNWNAERDADPNRFLVYVLSGGAAERRATGHYSPRDAADREYATTMCAVYLNQDKTSEAVRKELDLADTLARAMMLNDDLWAWVQRVAKALIRKRRLTGRQIHELRNERT